MEMKISDQVSDFHRHFLQRSEFIPSEEVDIVYLWWILSTNIGKSHWAAACTCSSSGVSGSSGGRNSLKKC
jgi:hypothetical protein